jgi:hypothetical protein
VQACGFSHCVRKVKYLHAAYVRSNSREVEEHALVAELFYVEQAALRSDIRVSEILDSVHNGSTNSTCYPIVVGFAYPADG